MGKSKRSQHAKKPWLAMLVYMLSGAACGVLMMKHITRLQDLDVSKGVMILHFVLLFLGMYASMVVQIIIHESGHLLFGLATGYRFSSFRIFSFMWIMEDGKLRLRRMRLAGTGGQCLMSPPELSEGKMPFLLYNFGGVLLNLITALLFLGAAFLCPAWSFGQMLLFFLSLIGIAMALINGIPMGTGPVNNDAKNALDMSRIPEAVRAFWVQMKISEMTARGVRLKDMPEEWFTVPPDAFMGNGIISSVGVFCCSRLMDQHRFQEADTLMVRMLSGKNGIVDLYRAMMVCDRMFIELTGKNRRERLDAMRTKGQLKLIKAMQTNPSVIRTEYAYALLGEKDAQKAEKFLKQFEKCAESYPYPSEIEGERELMEIASAASQA